MLHVARVCTPSCILMHVVGSHCAKFETGQTFSYVDYVQTGATTPKGLPVITQLKIVHLFKNKFTVTT